MTSLINNLRDLTRIFPGLYQTLFGHKHDHYLDFGWPENLPFEAFFRMYCRNGLAAAAVNKRIAKTWQDAPEIWETEEPTESAREKEIRQHFDSIRLWAMMAEADRRAQVGGYAGLILRFRDGRQFDQPVAAVRDGLRGLVEVVPAWENQLTVAEWENDPTSENYGRPKMFQFSEQPVDGRKNQNPRQFRIHPDRVLIWSADGTVNCRSPLEAGYNDLIDAEKVKGAGGEGFWKNARGALRLTAEEGVTPAQMAQSMDVPQGEVLDRINKQVDDFQAGFDKALLLGGMKADTLQINLPSPEHFFAAPVSCFAASQMIPVKILLGSQTGERASTEDANEWDQTNNARRVSYCKPLIREFINRLVRLRLLDAIDWVIGWSDLTEATVGEKMSRAKDMAEINAKAKAGEEIPFLAAEIREAAGYDPVALLTVEEPNPNA